MQQLPFLVRPGRVVHAVGHVADVRLLGEAAFVEVGEHLLRHTAVDAAHTVDLLRETAGEHTHRELVEGVAVVTAAVTHEGLPADVETLRVGGEVGAHQVLGEGVVAGGDGRVGGVERGGFHQLDSHLAVHVTALHHIEDALQVEECRVAFVEVVDGRVLADGLEHPHTADAEQDLLLEAVLDVAAVKGGGGVAVLLPVLIEVCVKEIERDAADIDAPDAGVEVTAGHGHAHHDPVALLVLVRLDGQLGEALRRVEVHLLAIRRNLLLEVAIAVEKSHAEHVHVAVAGLLEVVAGQHAETAGEDLQLVADTELHAEIGDAVFFTTARGVHIFRKTVVNLM